MKGKAKKQKHWASLFSPSKKDKKDKKNRKGKKSQGEITKQVSRTWSRGRQAGSRGLDRMNSSFKETKDKVVQQAVKGSRTIKRTYTQGSERLKKMKTQGSDMYKQMRAKGSRAWASGSKAWAQGSRRLDEFVEQVEKPLKKFGASARDKVLENPYVKAGNAKLERAFTRTKEWVKKSRVGKSFIQTKSRVNKSLKRTLTQVSKSVNANRDKMSRGFNGRVNAVKTRVNTINKSMKDRLNTFNKSMNDKKKNVERQVSRVGDTVKKTGRSVSKKFSELNKRNGKKEKNQK